MKKTLIFLIFILPMILKSSDFMTLYAHGIIHGPAQIERFAEAIGTQKRIAVRFPDAIVAKDWGKKGGAQSLSPSIVSKIISVLSTRSNMFMGQATDLDVLANAVNNQSDHNLILYGCSRGASAIISYMAKHNPTRVKALVLDGTCADMTSAIKQTLAQFNIDQQSATALFRFIFPAYPANAVTPLQAIKNITNKKLPILLIHSIEDKRVPVSHAYELYLEFKKQGFSNVHLIALPLGKHSFILDHKLMKPIYLHAVHSFYKKYDLPHNAEFTKTTFDLDAHKPSITDMQKLIIRQ